MKGPISKDIKIGFGLDGLEVATIFAGLLVVLGLLMESGPEAWKAFISRVWPQRAITGNVLVTVGVFAEVAIGLFIARSAKRSQLHAEALIAELNAETERLRKENDETLILRSYRSVGNLSAFEEAMRPFGGTKYRMQLLADSNEAAQLQWELNITLPKAGWISAGIPERRLNVGFEVDIYTVARPDSPFQSAASRALAEWLDGRSIATLTASIVREDLEVGTVVIVIGSRPETIEQHNQIRSEYARRKSLQPVTLPPSVTRKG